MARDAQDVDLSLPHMDVTLDAQRTRTVNRSLLEEPRSSQSFGVGLASSKSEAEPLLSPVALYSNSLHKAKVVTAGIVFAWFCSNIGLLLMNKYLLSNYGFKQPVFLTLCHMVACVILSTAFSTMHYVPKKSIQSSKQLMKISVLAVVFAMTVVLGNISLRFIPVSFSQVHSAMQCACIEHQICCSS